MCISFSRTRIRRHMHNPCHSHMGIYQPLVRPLFFLLLRLSLQGLSLRPVFLQPLV